MASSYRKIRFISIALVLLVFLHGCFYVIQRNKYGNHMKLENKPKEYTINTSGCQIPKLDPYHPTIKDLIEHLPELNCPDSLSSVIKLENNTLRIVKSENSGDTKCIVHEIFRKNDDGNLFGKAVRIANGSMTITSEFVSVECEAKGMNTYKQYYPFVFRKEDVEKRIREYKNKNKQKIRADTDRFRILMLGLDSASKNQFLRHIEKTYKFMKLNLVYAELHGYNKVGKNTFPNMLSMFTGQLEDEVANLTNEPSDVFPIVWKDFMENGYRSQYSEDAPYISAFNYARKGFDKQPVDYYLRPWSLAVDADIDNWETGCINDRPEAEVILKYAEDFFDLFPNDPLFSFTFFSRLSHDDLNQLSYHDKPVHDFFEKLYTKGHFNNTIMFFFGDHGFRYGDMRFTYVGRMEGRLPFMFIIVPPWFPAKYPEMYKNLKTNERRLTTPLDIYATLKDLLHFDGKGFEDEGKGRSISLFKHPIPIKRTCEDAYIQTQWCACVSSELVPLNDTRVKEAASEIVKKINFLLEKHDANCSTLSLVSIVKASKQDVPLGEDSTHDGYTNFLVTIKVSPSDGIFEGSVWFDGKHSYTVDNTIERINLYGNQSACINQKFLKPYCYCKV